MNKNNPPLRGGIKIKYGNGTEPPYPIDLGTLKAICKAKLIYSDFAQNVKPPFNLKAEAGHRLSIYDIRDAIKNINKREDPVTAFKEWFWLLTNILSDNVKIAGRCDETDFTDFPENEKEVFSAVFFIAEKLYWRLEERDAGRDKAEFFMIKFENEPKWDITPLEQDRKFEENAFFAVCREITDRIKNYLENRALPKEERTYSEGQMRHFIEVTDSDEALRNISYEELKLYRKFVNTLYEKGDIHALRLLAFGHYSGNRAFRQDWELSRKYLLELYEKYGDPYAANSLGYIYYYGRCGREGAEYEEAFKYFSYGAAAGIDESTYKCGDMLLAGTGTAKNVDMGLGMIIDGYRSAQEAFCAGAFDSKFADYAFRMGNICRDNLIYGMGTRDAYRFYLEAKFAIKLRKSLVPRYGDKELENEIEGELEKIRKRLDLDVKRKVLKADFPIYINQIYDDSFPVRVSIYKNRKRGKFILKIKRSRLSDSEANAPEIDDEIIALAKHLFDAPKILVTYPELSYTTLTSELRFELEGVSVLKKPEKGKYFLSDGFHRNESTGALEFYSEGAMMAVVKAEWFVIRIR